MTIEQTAGYEFHSECYVGLTACIGLQHYSEGCEVLRSACLYVCLSAGLRSDISKPHVQTQRNFLYMLHVVRSCMYFSFSVDDVMFSNNGASYGRNTGSCRCRLAGHKIQTYSSGAALFDCRRMLYSRYMYARGTKLYQYSRLSFCDLIPSTKQRTHRRGPRRLDVFETKQKDISLVTLLIGLWLSALQSRCREVKLATSDDHQPNRPIRPNSKIQDAGAALIKVIRSFKK